MTRNAYDPLEPIPPREPAHPPTVVFCGRLVETKGLDEVLALAAALRERGSEVRIALLGDGPLRSALEGRVRAEGLDHVEVLGFVSEHEKWRRLRGASLFVAPSREEGWGIAVGEALIAGVPAIVYDLPAYEHFGSLPCRVPLGDSEAFVAAALELLEDGDRLAAEQRRVEEAAPALPRWDDVIDAELRSHGRSGEDRSGRGPGGPMSALTDAPRSAVPPAQADDRRPLDRVLAFLARRRVQTVLAFVVYLAFAIGVTWPLALHPGSTLFGVIGGDLTSSVAQFSQDARSHVAPFLPGTLPDVNAPEGLPTDWALSLAGFGSSFSLWVLSMAFGAIAAHGIMAILGFAGSAFAMFLLVRRFLGHAGIAFAVGVAFGFWPYQYGTGWTWPHYIQLWVLVVLVWRMLVAMEKPTLGNGIWAGAAAILAMTWIQYNLLIAGVLFATLAVIALLRAWRAGTLRAQLATQAVASAIVALVVGGILVLAASSSFHGVPTRAPTDAVGNSARPLMYVVPGPRSPLFGDSAGKWIAKKYKAFDPKSTASYADIYLGVPLVLLALLGVGWTAQRVRRRGRAALDEPEAALGITATLVGAVAFVFSAPPKVAVLGVLIPTPYSVIQHFTTVFRVAHRFAVVVMLAACVLAAIGLLALLRRRSPRIQAVAVAVVAIVFAVDLSAPPTHPTTRTTHPAVYHLLARQGPGIVAEYPLEPPEISLNQQSYDQALHRHPLFTGYESGTVSESRKSELQYLRADRTVPDLARYGVRYVIVHELKEPPPGLPKLGSRIRGLQKIGGDPTGTLYRVLARPFARHLLCADELQPARGQPTALGPLDHGQRRPPRVAGRLPAVRRDRRVRGRHVPPAAHPHGARRCGEPPLPPAHPRPG